MEPDKHENAVSAEEFDRAVEKELKEENLKLSENRSRRPKRLNPWIAFVTWLVRLCVGGTFVFSGIVKCIDVWGTVYKMHDYLAAMGLTRFDMLDVPAAFTLCLLEFMVGVFLITGCFRRVTPWITALFMMVMLPLTLWIALCNPVADCGCFGDAFKISNWATFWKNVALSIATVWLIVFNRRVGWLIRPYLQWIAFVATGLFAGFIESFGYYQQPMIDFRPYPVGETIFNTSSVEEMPDFVFVYAKDGVEKEFRADDELPDETDGWIFIERREPKGATQSSTDEKELTIWSAEDDSDITEEVLGIGGRQLLVLFPDLPEASLSASYTLNSMYAWATAKEIDMQAILAASPEEIAGWSELWMPAYPLRRAEDTTLKEIARGNPAVIYLEDGKIIWKRTLKSIPVEDFMEKGTPADPTAFRFDGRHLLYNVSCLYIAVLAVLSVLSFIPAMVRMMVPREGRIRRRIASRRLPGR